MQNIIHSIISNISEAKIGDKVTVTHGSQKGLVGHVGEIRKGLGGRDHTYTVDYDDSGKRSSVQVKKAHVKRVMSEANDELNKKTPTQDEIMAKHGMSETEFNHHLQIGIKVEMEHTKNAMVAKEIAMDHLNEKPDYYAKLKKVVEEAEPIVEISKRVMGRYVQKAATSMATAAFGQGQASAQYKPPSEKDLKTGSKRMTGIVRATSKMAKEEVEGLDEKARFAQFTQGDQLVFRSLSAPGAPTKRGGTGAHEYGTKPRASTIAKKTELLKNKIRDSAGKHGPIGKLPEEVEQVNEAQSSESLKKMSDYHFKQFFHHDKKALDKSLSVDARKAHAMARAHHANAGENYLKASRDDGLNRDRYVDRAENHADAAEEHERKHHAVMEAVQIVEGTFKYHMDKAVAAHTRGDSKRALFHLNNAKHARYALKSTEMSKNKGLMDKYKQMTEEVLDEQELLSVGDKLTQSRKSLSIKKSREASIHHKNAEMHQAYEAVTPHAVEINLTHPQVDGPTYKNVKINAQSVKQATKLVSDHYTKRGFKVKDVMSAKPHKMPATLSPEAQAKEQEKEAQAVEKKENNTINKIAKAIKGAVK